MLNWFEQRRQKQQFEREIQVRQGKKRIRKHIEKQRGAERRLWQLGKRALQLHDHVQFGKIGKQILWTQKDVERWERYLLNMETMEARRDQVQTSADFMQTIQALSQSMLVGADPRTLAQTQRDMEMGLARAESLNERLDMFMGMADDMLYSVDLSDIDELRGIEEAIEREAVGEEVGDWDAEIAAGLERIRAQMG